MKKVLVLLIILLFTNNIVLGIEDNTLQPILQSWTNNSKQNNNKNHSKLSYLHYYSWDELDTNMNMKFNAISKAQYKLLNKEEKRAYKNFVKYNKYIQKGSWGNVIYYWDSQYVPALIAAYKQFEVQNKFRDCVIYLEKIKYKNDILKIFDKEMIDIKLGYAYWADKDYYKAIKIFESYLPNSSNIYHKITLGQLYFDVNKYNDCLKLLNNINKKDTSLYIYKNILETKFLAYSKLKDNKNANKMAYELYSYTYPDKRTASLRIAFTTQDTNIQMKFYNIAKQNSFTDSEIWSVNSFISNILDNRIKNHCKTISGYYKPLLWQEIISKDSNYMSIRQENNRFEDYLNDTNNCINKYSNSNLKACLNDIKNKQEHISTRLLQERQELNRQITEMERIRQLQLINSNIMEQNNLIQQQNYELSRPRYYNSTTSQYGNTYYTNTYSY